MLMLIIKANQTMRRCQIGGFLPPGSNQNLTMKKTKMKSKKMMKKTMKLTLIIMVIIMTGTTTMAMTLKKITI